VDRTIVAVGGPTQVGSTGGRGKSELRRAVRRVIPGRGDPTDSGTENIPPAFALGSSSFRLRRGRLSTACFAEARSPKDGGRRRVRVKRCGKSAPRFWQQKWQAKPRTEQDQIGRRLRAARPKPPGRLLDPVSNAGTRGMIVSPGPRRAHEGGRYGGWRRTEFGLQVHCGTFQHGAACLAEA
jgi:hypothetical protein